MAASNSNHRGTSGGGIQLGSAWFQRKINLRPQHRGVHLVTEEILRQMPELGQFSVGLCHVQSKNFFFLPSSLFFSGVLCHLVSLGCTFFNFKKNMQQCAFCVAFNSYYISFFPFFSLNLWNFSCWWKTREYMKYFTDGFNVLWMKNKWKKLWENFELFLKNF